MKSLFIVNDFPPIKGGQSAYLYTLCRAFPKKKLLVLAPWTSGCLIFDAKQSFPVIRKPYVFAIPLVEKIIKIVLPFIYAIKIIKQNEIKDVHCAHVLSTGIVGLLLKKFFKKRYVVYTYSADIMEYQKYFLIKKLLIYILRQADNVVAISDYNKDRLLELGVPSDKIIKIMPKIDLEKFRNPVNVNALKTRYPLEGKKIILSVNRLIERKGNDRLIEALPRIRRKIPEAVYIIVGAGEHKNKLHTLVDLLNLRDVVFFVDSATDEDVLNFYNLCDVFVMLSRELKEKGDAEGFGIVFLEANACGKPVVAGDSGGTKDAVVHDKTGILVDPNDIDAIAQAVIKILKDNDYAHRLGATGQERVKNHFDWRQTADEIKKEFFT